jgi:vacuolar-type H+-ATPase subunit I/STV1
MVFLITNNVWSKPTLEIASFQNGSGAALKVNTFVTGSVDGIDFKKYLKNHYKYTNVETRFYVDDKGFVVVGDSESIPADVRKNDLVVTGNLFVNGTIFSIPFSQNSPSKLDDELKTKISTLEGEVTILKSEIAGLKDEIRALKN